MRSVGLNQGRGRFAERMECVPCGVAGDLRADLFRPYGVAGDLRAADCRPYDFCLDFVGEWWYNVGKY